MQHRILLAGATGAIGRRLSPLLLEAGHTVFGMTRSRESASTLKAAGLAPVIADVFDAETLVQAVAWAAPTLIIHQLTDLPPALDPARMGEAVGRNARIRREGTRNLVAAALAAGADRMIAQSIAWAYAPGPEPHAETDPLDLDAEGVRAVSVGGVVALERAVLQTPPLRGVVLRYGQLYGPGTGFDASQGSAPLHVDAAASAALLAIDRVEAGIFNIAEPNAYAATDAARRALGWDSGFRLRPAVAAAAG